MKQESKYQVLFSSEFFFKDIKVKVLILINDTVGTLMSCSYKDPRAAIGLILGTGTNACYIENIQKIDLIDVSVESGQVKRIKTELYLIFFNYKKNSEYRGFFSILLFQQQMIVNTEWGAFGENGSIDFIRSRYDEEIDKTSINIGKQM